MNAEDTLADSLGASIATGATPGSDLLCALLLKLRAGATGLLPAFWGTLAQGAWLRWVEQVDPALSARLHTEIQERPYTCSTLWLPDRREQTRLQEAGQRTAVRQGQICWLRLTLLDGTLFALFAHQARGVAAAALEQAALRPLTLNGIPFDLLEMVVDNRTGYPTGSSDDRSSEALWSGWTSYQRLREQGKLRSTQQLERMALEFDTPTALGGLDHPWGRETALLPEPLRVFGGLARRWRRFAPPALAEAIEPEALAQYLEERVWVEEYALRTQRLHLRQALLLGFVGRCAYRLPPDDADDRLRRQVHLLADYAFYAGIGSKTAQGLGRARRVGEVAVAGHPCR